jgi:hypothetical protein
MAQREDKLNVMTLDLEIDKPLMDCGARQQIDANYHS